MNTTIDLEREILLAQMRKPKKTPLSGAERQARYRYKIKSQARSGEMAVSAIAFQEAIMDALAQIAREGDPVGHVNAVLLRACVAFRCPEQARRVMVRRIKARPIKVLKDPLAQYRS